MAPKRKECNWLLKNRQDSGDHQVGILTTPNRNSNKTMIDNTSVEEWIHSFLGTCL
jgi:hypothetical protein